MNENKKIGEPSSEAIDFAKRMIALKWTRETNVDIIAGNWMAGYVYGKIDSNKESASDKDKEIERLKGLIETEFKGVWIEDRFNSFIYAEYGETIATERANELWQQFKKKNKL